MFGTSQDSVRNKKRVLGLANALEMAYTDPSRYGVVVDAASQLCTLLKDQDVSLTMSEKVRVLRSVTRAKVKAFMSGTGDVYKTLDSISSDLVQLL